MILIIARRRISHRIILISKIRSIWHRFGQYSIHFIVFALRVMIFRQEVVIFVSSYFFLNFLVCILVIVVVLHVELLIIHLLLKFLLIRVGIETTTFDFQVRLVHAHVQSLACIFENSIFKTLIAEANVFDFVKIGSCKLLERVFADDILQQTYFTCLSGWVEFEQRR